MAEIHIPDIKPNSNKYKEEQKKDREKLEPIVKGNAVVSSKKSFGKRAVELLLGTDLQKTNRDILSEVIIPGIKNMVLKGVEMAFFHKVSSGNYYDNRSYGQKTSYSSYYSSSYSRQNDRSSEYVPPNDHVDYRSIVLRNRYDAEKIVDKLRFRIREDRYATVADLLDLVGIPGRFTDNDWGWDNERDIGMRPVSDGFLIDVPEAKYLQS